VEGSSDAHSAVARTVLPVRKSAAAISPTPLFACSVNRPICTVTTPLGLHGRSSSDRNTCRRALCAANAEHASPAIESET